MESEVCKQWRKKAYVCYKNGRKAHQWIPISHLESKTATHVSMLMCGACFLQIHVNEATQYSEHVETPDYANDDSSDEETPYISE